MTNQTTTPASADTTARDFAQQAINGQIDETDAKRQIAWAIEATGLIDQVVAKPFGLSDRLRGELAVILSDHLLLKAAGDGSNTDLDLAVVAAGEKSVTGWARQMLGMALVSKLRDIRYRDTHHLLTSPTAPDDDDSLTGLEAAFHRSSAMSVEDEIEDARFAETFESFQDIKGLRRIGQIRQNAHHLRVAFEITAPIIIPELAADRLWVQEQLEANETLAYQSLTQWLSIVEGAGFRGTRVDDRLLGMWDEFTTDGAEVIADRGVQFAHTLALGAILRAPKPSRTTIRAAARTVIMAAAGSEWEKNARALVNSWVARNCEATSEFASKTKNNGSEAADILEAELAAGNWDALVKVTANWNKQPIGRNEDQIDKFLARVFTSVDPQNFPPIA